jgi:hypothetical protein
VGANVQKSNARTKVSEPVNEASLMSVRSTTVRVMGVHSTTASVVCVPSMMTHAVGVLSTRRGYL